MKDESSSPFTVQPPDTEQTSRTDAFKVNNLTHLTRSDRKTLSPHVPDISEGKTSELYLLIAVTCGGRGHVEVQLLLRFSGNLDPGGGGDAGSSRPVKRVATEP